MHEDLFGIFRPFTLADLNSVSDPSFGDWAKQKLKEGTLNDILSELVKSGIVGNTVWYSGRLDWRDMLDWDDWNTLFIKHGKWLS